MRGPINHLGFLALRGPIAFQLVRSVRDRAFYHENEGVDFATGGAVKTVDELIAHLVGEDRIVDTQGRHARQRPGAQILDCGLRRGCQSDRLAIAAEAGRQPQDVDSVMQRAGGLRQIAQYAAPQEFDVLYSRLPRHSSTHADGRGSCSGDSSGRDFLTLVIPAAAVCDAAAAVLKAARQA